MVRQLGLTARFLRFRCDKRASATWHHGVQGVCLRPCLRYTTRSRQARLQADIHTARMPGKPLQEVHRFLLTDANGQPIDDPVLRDRVVKQARLLHLLRVRAASLTFCVTRSEAGCLAKYACKETRNTPLPMPISVLPWARPRV